MAFQASADVPLLVTSANARSERRISPAWTVDQLRARLEPVTGVPVSSQRLTLKSSSGQTLELNHASDMQLHQFSLTQYDTLQVEDERPVGLRENYTDTSTVAKYEMPKEEYESRTDSVLAWKKAQKLGRFDPNAPSLEQQKIDAIQREVDERKIREGARCRLQPDTDSRRGIVMHVGPVPEIPGLGAWVGIALDEPTGKNDGTVKGTRYFHCQPNQGVFVRPDRIEVGDFPLHDDLDDEDEEF